MIGVPAFDASTDVVNLGIPRPDNIDAEAWNVCTLTFRYHGAPFDYYRFTERAVQEIFLEGFASFSFRKIMVPPRIIGFGSREHG